MHYHLFRWIYHHYLAMLMALVSLTWEIKGQPDCSSKQVNDHFSEKTSTHFVIKPSNFWNAELRHYGFLFRGGYNFSCGGQSCKELQCIYRIGTSVKDCAPG